ncbi:MAG TPA: DUF1343 domain-containing protein [Thermoprotei archaeon]|nr:DUF1343 domain-containing protein [Thermoprotei archaeon]
MKNDYSEFEWIKRRGEYFFDLLTGGNKVRLMLEQNCSVEEIAASWRSDLMKFKEDVEELLMY